MTLYARLCENRSTYLYGRLMVTFYGSDPIPFVTILNGVRDSDNEAFWLTALLDD